MAQPNSILMGAKQLLFALCYTLVVLNVIVCGTTTHASPVASYRLALSNYQHDHARGTQQILKDQLSPLQSGLSWNRLTETPLYFQVQFASSSETDFPDAALFFDYERSFEQNFVSAFSVGRKVADRILVWPFDLVAYASVQRFDDRGFKPDSWGVTIFAKAYQSFLLPYFDLPLRLGFGQGLSYVSRIPVSEVRDFLPHQSEKLVYYLDYSLQTSLSHLTGGATNFWSPNIEEVYVGYTIWHRSTFFGLFGDTTGGTNYLGLSFEAITR